MCYFALYIILQAVGHEDLQCNTEELYRCQTGFFCGVPVPILWNTPGFKTASTSAIPVKSMNIEPFSFSL